MREPKDRSVKVPTELQKQIAFGNHASPSEINFALANKVPVLHRPLKYSCLMQQAL
jgi:hypothetical protein